MALRKQETRDLYRKRARHFDHAIWIYRLPLSGFVKESTDVKQSKLSLLIPFLEQGPRLEDISRTLRDEYEISHPYQESLSLMYRDWVKYQVIEKDPLCNIDKNAIRQLETTVAYDRGPRTGDFAFFTTELDPLNSKVVKVQITEYPEYVPSKIFMTGTGYSRFYVNG